VGRLSEEKGFHHLISVAGQLAEEGLPVGLVIAGEGHLREQLQAQINELELQGLVRLTGFLADPRELYRAIDVFVLSSLREGLPNVVLEAMASNRAVVATKCNGIPQLVQHGRNGLIVPIDDAVALRAAVRECVVSEARRNELAAAGRRTVEGRFCFDRRMQKVVEVYRQLSSRLADSIPPECDSSNMEEDLEGNPIDRMTSRQELEPEGVLL
jgi:glycosyltransferase involved in cell wall biosynthesis